MIDGFKVCYHGTIDIYAYNILGNVSPNKGRHFTDFGQGFYVTTSYEQAHQMAIFKYKDNLYKYKKIKPAVVKMMLNIDEIKAHQRDMVKIFEEPDDKWCDFVYNCRIEGKENRLFHSHSVVCGPLADGKISPLIKRIQSGKITKDEFKRGIKPKGILKDQLSFHKEDLLHTILEKEVILIENLQLQP